MKLLVELKIKVVCYITMLFVQSVSCCADLICQLAQSWIVVWLDDIVVPLKLGKIERLFHHLCILIESGSVLFEVAQICFFDKLTSTFGLRINVLQGFNNAT